jgi:hypothetical protein
MTQQQLTDKGEMIMFIDGQFSRLGMFKGTHHYEMMRFIQQLDTRTKWRVLMCVVDYVNVAWKEHFGWCDW